MSRLICLIRGHMPALRWTRKVLHGGQALLVIDAVCVRCGAESVATGREKWEIVR